MHIPNEVYSALSLFLGNGGPNGIGVCYRDADGEFHTLIGYGCEPSRRIEFVEVAPENVYLFAATVVCELSLGIVLSPDRRAGGRLAGTTSGWSRSGETAKRVAEREFHEEVCAWLEGMDLPASDPCRLERVQIVPREIVPRENVPMLGVTLTGYRQVGELEYVGVNVDETTKVVDFIYRWRLGHGLTSEEEKLLRMVWTEQMDADPTNPADLGGTYLGSNFIVVDPVTGQYKGTFCGRQPLLDTRSLPFHHAVSRYSELICGLMTT